MATKNEYMVLRKITPKKEGAESVYEPYTVLAASPLEAAETVASELYASQTPGNEYEFLAHTLKSFSAYQGKTQVIVRLEKLTPVNNAHKVGEAE